MSKTRATEIHDRLVAPGEIERAYLEELFADKDFDIRGVAFDFLHSPSSKKLRPSMTRERAHGLSRNYLAQCIIADPDGDWCESRYQAAWTASSIIVASWDEMESSEKDEWVEWIKGLCLSKEPGVRQACETGLLEHVLHVSSIRKRFLSWLEDERLKPIIEICLAVSGSAAAPR